MATLAPEKQTGTGDDRYFVTSALVMAAIVFAGFSLQLAMGRSSFGAPLIVHVHALVFMGWMVIYVAQTTLAASGDRAKHRLLGWLGTAWVVPMVVLGITVTVLMVRRGQAPFFFQPAQFLVLNPVNILTFAGLTWAAVAMRRRTGWHRRLHYCGTATLLAPAFGRLLPMPLIRPWAFELVAVFVMLVPLVGIVADRRRSPPHRARPSGMAVGNVRDPPVAHSRGGRDLWSGRRSALPSGDDGDARSDGRSLRISAATAGAADNRALAQAHNGPAPERKTGADHSTPASFSSAKGQAASPVFSFLV